MPERIVITDHLWTSPPADENCAPASYVCMIVYFVSGLSAMIKCSVTFQKELPHFTMVNHLPL